MSPMSGWRTDVAVLETLQRRIEREPNNPLLPIWKTAVEALYQVYPHLRPKSQLEPLAPIVDRVMSAVVDGANPQ